jgi:hypoxanthine phosphoribosyltransferase
MGFQPELKILIGRERIDTVVSRLAAEINKDYQNRELTVIGVLCGAFVFLADLIRRLEMPLEVDFVGLSSYGAGQESSGEIRLTKSPTCQLSNKHVLIVEDITDTGLTSNFLLKYLKQQKPASLKLCTLMDKAARRQVSLVINYRGFTVPDKFLVGYGLDCGGKYRNLPDINYIEDETKDQ